MLSCEELLELPSLKGIKVVAGKAGLKKEAAWIQFIDSAETLRIAQPGELLLFASLHDDMTEEKLTSLVEAAASNGVVGLIVILRQKAHLSPMIRRCADALNFPVFEFFSNAHPGELLKMISRYILMKELKKNSSGEILENMLFNANCDYPSLVQQAAYYEYDLTQAHCVCVIHAIPVDPVAEGEKTTAWNPGVFEGVVNDVLSLYFHRSMSLVRENNIILLLPELTYRYRDTVDNGIILQEVIERCKQHMPAFDFVIGAGLRFSMMEKIVNSFKQAQLTLKFADFIQGKNKVYNYQDLGVFKLLFKLDEETLLEYYQETLGEIDEYDKTHGTDLIDTLQVYFRENGNSIRTAKKMFVHKNTLLYRLKKVEDITGKNVDRMQDRLSLLIGLIIGRQMSE